MTFVNASSRDDKRQCGMLAQQLASAERTVPRYTSYPTAPHFGPGIDANIYASWLEGLPASEALSLYLHVPFCKELCLYCGCNTKASRRSEPIESYAEILTREIDLVAARTGHRRITHLHWGGGTPSMLGPDRLRALVATLATRFDLTALREHAFELDPRYVTNALGRALIDIGVTRASLGVQDLSPHVQQAIGRIQPFDVVQRAVSVLRESGIEPINIDLMYGLPGQSMQDVRQSILLAHELKPQRFAIFGYAHVPWFKPHQKRIDATTLPGAAERMTQARCAHQTLTALGYRPVGLDHYARDDDALAVASRAGRLRRNFQGYTTDDADVLIALGTSAIGQLPQGYVQNAADIAGYARAILSGRFATVRGIALSADDRLRARIISDLMCNMTCDLESLAQDERKQDARKRGEPTQDLPTFESELRELKPFAAEGLVRIDGRRIVVEEDGRPYLRLISAAFDSYLAGSAARHSASV